MIVSRNIVETRSRFVVDRRRSVRQTRKSILQMLQLARLCNFYFHIPCSGTNTHQSNAHCAEATSARLFLASDNASSRAGVIDAPAIEVLRFFDDDAC